VDYSGTNRRTLVAKIISVLFALIRLRDILRVGGSELTVFRVVHPVNQLNVTRMNWSAVGRR
jgi:hypothetical protein